MPRSPSYPPGTETCLKIGGYVRFKVEGVSSVGDDYGRDFVGNIDGDDYQLQSRVRVRLDFDAREETELGMLRAFARVQATNTFGNGDQNYSMDMGYIQLGGLTMGYLDSLFTSDDGLLTDTDLAIGDIQRNQLRYTYAADGFSAAVSFEDDASGDWRPGVVGQLKYEGGWGYVYAAGAYENSVRSFNRATNFNFGVDGFGGDDSFVLKGGLSLKDLVATDSVLKFEGSYAFDPSSYSTIGLFSVNRAAPIVTGAFDFNGTDSVLGTVPVEWQVGAGYKQGFGKLEAGLSGAYGETFDFFGPGGAVLGTSRVAAGSADNYKLVGNEIGRAHV